MRKITVPYEYENPLVYELIYKPSDHDFFQEAWSVVLIACRFFKKKPAKIAVLELFSGDNYMANFLIERFNSIGIEVEYSGLDLYNKNATYQQDVQKFKIDKKFDIIFSTYMSFEACGSIDFGAAIKPINEHLKPNGMFICNRGANRENLPETQADFSEIEFTGKYHLLERPVLAKLLPNLQEFNPEFEISYKYRHKYDRLTGIVSSDWLTPVSIRQVNGPMLLQITIKQGMEFQFLTEKEIGAILLRGLGKLDTVHLYATTWEEYVSPIQELPRYVNGETVEDDWPNFNWFMFTKV